MVNILHNPIPHLNVRNLLSKELYTYTYKVQSIKDNWFVLYINKLAKLIYFELNEKNCYMLSLPGFLFTEKKIYILQLLELSKYKKFLMISIKILTVFCKKYL